MQVELSKSELDLIIIALKGFVDDNALYVENIIKEISEEELKNLEHLNLLTESLVMRLEKALENKKQKKERKWKFQTYITK